MKKTLLTLGSCTVLAVSVWAADAAKEAQKPQPAEKAAAAGAPVVTPGPEHAVLKDYAGSWDATVEHMMPGQPPSKSSASSSVDFTSGAIAGSALVLVSGSVAGTESVCSSRAGQTAIRRRAGCSGR